MAIGEFQPIDLLGLQGGMGNLPTAANVQALGNQQAAAAAGIDALRANALQQQAQAAQALEAQQRAQQFQADLASHLGDGSPQSTSTLMRRYPEFAKQLQEAHLLERDDVREADVQWMTGVYSRAYNGDWKGAEALARKRLDAERAAGGDTSDEQELVDALASGDPALQKRALGILGMDLAGRVGLDKWNEAYGGTVVGDSLVNRGTGVPTYTAPAKAEKTQYMNVDGTVIALGGNMGGGDTFEQAHNFVAGVEGGYAARDGKSGAPVNYGVNQGANPDIDVKSLTPDTAKQILRDRYWVPSGAADIADPALATVVYDTAVNMGPGMAKAMLKASGGDVEKFLDAREKRYRAIGGPDLPGWLNRNAKLREAVGGMGAASGPKVVYSGPSSAQKSVKKDVIAMRKEFDGLSEVKAYKEIAPVLMSARRAPDTPAGDIQLAYTVGKILDPNSVVREGELALAIKAGSPLERLLGTGTYVAGQGARMTPEIRRQLLEMVNERALAVRQQYDAARANYEGYARDMGVAPASIIGQHVANAYAPKGGAAAGGWSYGGEAK